MVRGAPGDSLNLNEQIPLQKGSIFDTAVLITTDFFDADISPTNSPTTFRIYITMDTAGVINIERDDGTTQIQENLNAGNALVADCAYEFNITVLSGQTINLQYSIAAQILACIVTEIYG